MMIKKLNALFDKKDKKTMSWVLLIIFIQGIVQVIGVVSVAPFMAMAANPKIIYTNQKLSYIYDRFHFSSEKSFLIFTGAVLLFVFLFNDMYSMFATWRILRFSARQNRVISTRLLACYLAKPYSFFLMNNSAGLAKNILVESTALAEGVILPFMQGLANVVSITLICLVLIIVNPKLAFIVALTFSGAYFTIYLFFQKGLTRYGKERLVSGTDRFKVTNEAFGGIKEVKSSGREENFVRRFSIVAERFSDLVVKSQLIQQLPKYLLEVVAFGGVLVMTIYLISTKKDFSEAVPVLALYALAGYRLMPSLQQLYLSVTTIRFNRSVVDIIFHDMEEYSADDDKKDSDLSDLVFANKIKLEEITFFYNESDMPALNKLSVEIKKNSSVAFVGSTGAGKTTLVDIILGLLKPTLGEIMVDDSILSDVNYIGWKKLIGYIPQEIFLCDGSIASNIAFGFPESEIDMNQVERVAKIANLHDFVSEQLPKKYHTFVGERGVRLSGGQRQRIGIARALYSNPEILILDEATSALDTITESAVIDAVKNLQNQKTIIMIAHRLTTVRECDIIYFLEKGEIIDSGTFTELVEKNAKFRAMTKLDKSFSTDGARLT